MSSSVEQANEMLQQFSEAAIYLMGVSFALGSLTTILALLMLDWLRKGQEDSARKRRGDSHAS